MSLLLLNRHAIRGSITKAACIRAAAILSSPVILGFTTIHVHCPRYLHIESGPPFVESHTYPKKSTSIESRLENIVRSFRAPVRFALAYGSGVYRQQGYDESAIPASPSVIYSNSTTVHAKSAKTAKPMVDFIFGVTHSEHWHSLNIKQNPHHYSSIAALGTGTISKIQDSFGAGLFYNTDIEIEGARIKYGVVRLDRLIHDLKEWDNLYIAGRMQKPVMILRDDAQVRLASQTNLLNAVRVSLLMLPPPIYRGGLVSKDC
ncbi:hypothetical protein BASA60_005284 [Batrachochytrium salamandrivorans]|nr:hypothetical protein BASA60_005284 [Batrachochytrium salamandrivorans]